MPLVLLRVFHTSAPRIQHMMRTVQSADPLRPGARLGDRVLQPHEQTEISSLWLSRKELVKMAKEFNARKVRVQVGMAYANFTEGDHFTSRNGHPDWRDESVERTNILDAEDAAAQACK